MLWGYFLLVYLVIPVTYPRAFQAMAVGLGLLLFLTVLFFDRSSWRFLALIAFPVLGVLLQNLTGFDSSTSSWTLLTLPLVCFGVAYTSFLNPSASRTIAKFVFILFASLGIILYGFNISPNSFSEKFSQNAYYSTLLISFVMYFLFGSDRQSLQANLGFFVGGVIYLLWFALLTGGRANLLVSGLLFTFSLVVLWNLGKSKSVFALILIAPALILLPNRQQFALAFPTNFQRPSQSILAFEKPIFAVTPLNDLSRMEEWITRNPGLHQLHIYQFTYARSSSLHYRLVIWSSYLKSQSLLTSILGGNSLRIPVLEDKPHFYPAGHYNLHSSLLRLHNKAGLLGLMEIFLIVGLAWTQRKKFPVATTLMGLVLIRSLTDEDLFFTFGTFIVYLYFILCQGGAFIDSLSPKWIKEKFA